MPHKASAKSRPSITSTTLLLLSIVSAAVVVFVCWGTPLLLLAGAGGDDGLYIKLGMNIANGSWLGPFNVLTLAKGPGYPLFLAASHFSGLPITVSQSLLLVVSIALFSLMVAKVARSPTLGFILFILTVMHPSFVMERVLRDAIYTAQIFLLLGCLIGAFYAYPRRPIVWSAAAGISTSWFWLTREEGVWIVPAVAGLIAVAALRNWWLLRQWQQSATAIVVFVVFFAAGQLSFQALNWKAYGRFQGVDVKEANFQAALTALQSVRDGDQIPFVPVSKSTRSRIYVVSPTFALMRPTFDPPNGKTPDAGCQYYPWTCGDIAGGWFMFFLKGTASGLGAYRSPDAAAEFFGRLASEVTTACSDGRLTCRPNPIPFMPRVTIDQLLDLPSKLMEAAYFLVDEKRWRLPAATTGTPQQQADAIAFLNNPATRGAGLTTMPHRATLEAVAGAIRDWWTPLYSWGMAALLPLGLAAFFPAAILSWRRKAGMQLVVIAGSLWMLLFARLGLVAMIEISSFPAISKWYLSPALYLSAAAPALTILCLLRGLRSQR
jgi:hypothetical protein